MRQFRWGQKWPTDDFGGSGNLINQDPDDLFEDPSSGDFRPKPNSALIQAGENLIEDFQTDIVGNERPSVGAWDSGAFQYVPPYVAYDISYTYDAVGNRLTKVDVHEGTTTYIYDAANQLISEITPLGTINYEYDLNGNRIEKDDPVAGVTNYTYDETNRMTSATTPDSAVTTLIYNGADQVVEKQSPEGVRKFVYDGKKLLLETKADDSTELTYDFALTDEYGELTSRYHDATAGTDYYQYDGLGSTETMSDEAEADVDVYRYKAFGQITQQFGTEENDFTFVGRQGYFYYPELDLYFAGMQGGAGKPGRLVDPKTAQWTSQDPIRDNEANLYIYAGNNPVNKTDPSGHQVTKEETIANYKALWGADDFLLRAFLEVGNEIEMGDVLGDVDVDWKGGGGGSTLVVVQIEEDLASPVQAALYLRQKLVEVLGYSEEMKKQYFAIHVRERESVDARGDFITAFKEIRASEAKEIARVITTTWEWIEVIVGVVNEGADYSITIKELSEGNVSAAIGFIPFVPSAAGKVGKVRYLLKHGDVALDISDDALEQLVKQGIIKSKAEKHILELLEDTASLARNMEKARIPRPAKSHAHHIIAKARNIDSAVKSRAILEKFEIDVNNVCNGVYLPAGTHARMHTNEYYNEIYRRLEPVQDSLLGVVRELDAIRKELLDGTFRTLKSS